MIKIAGQIRPIFSSLMLMGRFMDVIRLAFPSVEIQRSVLPIKSAAA